MAETPLVTEPVEINPLTGLPIGGTPTIDTTGPQEAPINPLTGIPMQNVRPSVTLGGGAGTPDLMQSQLYGSQYNTYRKDDINRYLKYDVPLGQDLDWDELRARNQSTADKWGNGLAKMGVTALGAVAENTIGFFAGMGELMTGGAYYDNVVGKTVDNTNEWMREHMPNYYTKREQELSVIGGMSTANFWADKVAGGVGYSIGAIASLYVTGGGGLLMKGGAMAARGMGIYNTSKAIINGTNLAKSLTQGAALSTRLRTAAQTLEAGAMMSLAEGSVEARETQRQTYDTLVQQYLQERPGMTEGDIPSQKLQDFEDVSYAAGNTNFAMQMPVLMGTNLLMFGKQVAGFKGMSKANTDVLFDAAANQAVNNLAKQGIVAQSLSRLRPLFVNGMGETVQESLQFGSGAFSSTYHTDKYNNGGHGDMSKALAAAGDAMLSKEGLESALIGFLTGAIMGGGQSIVGKQYTNRKNNAQALTDLINSGIFDKTNQRYQTAEASSAVIKRMHDALQKGDHKSFKDEQFKLIQYQALEALERGGFDVMLQKLEDSKELPEAEFMSAYGYPQEDNSGKPITLKDSTNKSQDQILDGVIEKLNRFEQTYNNVNERFPLQDKTSGLPRLLMSQEERAAEDAVYSKQENLRSNLIFYGSEIKDRNRRMDSITNQMQDTLDTSLQGSAYAGTGPQLDVHGALQEQRPSFKGIDLLKDETGEVKPASEYNPLQQLKNTGDRLQQIADNLRLTDPIAADKFLEQAQDYMGLLQANNSAIDSYNKLSSDEYVQAEMQREIEEREAIAKQNKIDKTVAEAVENAQTSEDFKDVDFENASPEIASKGKAKLMELRDAEANEYRKYMSEQPNESDSEKLERLKKLDKTTLTPIQKAGLATAINVLEKKLSEEPVAEEEVPSREEDSVLEEAFKPDNVGKVEVISEDGREFQVDGVKLYNRELNPLDAIVRTRAGRIKKIRLTDEYGNRQVIWGPEGRVDTLAYAILMSEQFKIDSELGKVREEILEQKEVVTEEVDKELGTKGVHGAKTSDSLRQEIYSLELGLNEILEVYDNLRTSYIQEAGATKEELKNDPALKELKSKIRSLKLQIANRRRILKVRNEDVTPTDPEILKVENKANAAIEDYNITLSESENAVKQLQDEIAQQENLLDRYKQADDLDSWRQAINDIKNKEALILKEVDKQEKLKHKINYQQTKLKRLQDAKDNDPNQNAEPTEQGITEQAEGPIDEREDKNIGEIAEEQETVVEEDVAEEKFNNEEKATQKQVIITQNSNANKAEDNQSEPGTPIQGIIFGLPEGMSEQDLMQEGSTTDLGNLIAPSPQQTSEVKLNKWKRKDIQDLFDSNPSLSQIGSIEQYNEYLKSIFPNSKVDHFLYHGTDTKFETFDMSTQNKNTDPNFKSEGFFFARTKQNARDFGSNVKIVILNQENPYVKEGGINEKGYYEYADQVDDVKAARKAGNDSAILDINEGGLDGDVPVTEHIVFNPNQIHELGTKQDIQGFKEFVKNPTQQSSEVKVSSEKEFIPDMAPDGYIKTIFINGEYSGEFALLDVGDEVRLSGSLGARTELDKKQRGKGYGYKAYLVLAEQVKAEGKTLVSDSSMTKDAVRVWNKLVKNGYATKVGKTYKINNSKINTTQQASEVNEGIKKSEYEVHVTGDMLSGWDMSTTIFNVPGIKIQDIRGKSWEVGGRIFEESIQNGKKVFTVVDGSIYRKGRRAGISASMVFNENTTTTLNDVKSNLMSIMDSLLGVKETGSFTKENITFDWSKLDIKEIATPALVTPTPVENGQEMYTKNVTNGKDKKKYQQVQKIIDLGKKLDDTNAEWRILNDFGNIGGRAVVEIGTTDGDTFLMYQSSGTGTGIASKGMWTPIPGFAKDGFFLKAGFNLADNKMLTDQEFVDRGRLDADNPKFNHYGSNTFAAIAEELGRPASPIENEGIENTSTNELEVKAANIDKVRKVGEDTYDFRAPRRIVVDESGSAERHVPDMSNGQIITINQDLLLAPDIVGTEVTFEIRPNDYFTERVEEEGLENSWEYVPIYYKIGNEYVGKLAESKSLDRKALANKLENGEVVTTKISKVISGAQNVNHAIKEDGTPFFTHPEAVFGKNEVILGITNGIGNRFELGDVDSSLDQGDSETITTAVGATPIGNIGSGQVISVIRGKNNPQGDPRVTPLSTANLNSTAQEAVMGAFKAKDLNRAKEIIANGKELLTANTGVPGVYNKTYLDISEFPDGSKAIVYTSPSTGKLIRIKDTQLQKALNGEEHKYDFVKLAADPRLEGQIKYQVYTPKNNIVDIKEDLTKFVASKKYQVNKDLMNMATDYTSPIIGKYDAEGNWIGKTYKSTPDAPLGYQQYLFSNEEVAGGRILSTDLVKVGESLFNNPEVTFESIDKNIEGQVEAELKIERFDGQIIEGIPDGDISFDENPNNCN